MYDFFFGMFLKFIGIRVRVIEKKIFNVRGLFSGIDLCIKFFLGMFKKVKVF